MDNVNKELESQTPKVRDDENLDVANINWQLNLDGLKCPIQSVTVYNDRAEIMRRIEINAEKNGNYEIILEGFSKLLDKNSIRLSPIKGKVSILEVSEKISFRKKNSLEGIQKMKDELDSLIEEKNVLEENLNRIQAKNDWLSGWSKKMQEIGTKSPQTLDANYFEQIQSFLNFYEKQLSQIDTIKAEINKKVATIDSRQQAISAELNQSGSVDSPTCEITITINVQKAGTIVLELSYIVTQASWKASYDVRVNSKDSSMQLIYYGVISNNSNEDWKDTKLLLSTATPSVGGTPPPLPTATVSFTAPIINHRRSSPWISIENPLYSPNVLYTQSDYIAQKKSPKESVEVMQTEAEENITSTTFAIPRIATILSDNKPHKVTVSIVNLKSLFTYSAVPRRSPYVYLKATTTNTSDYPFLEGNMNVFMDNNFITNSSLKAVNCKEDFALYLGIDQAIKLYYKPLKKVKEIQGYISKSNSETIHRAISVKNTKSVEILVVVYEQLPLSNDERVKVKLIEPDLKKEKDVKLTEANNLEWRFTLSPGQKKDIEVQYVYEWPQKMEINVDLGFS